MNNQKSNVANLLGSISLKRRVLEEFGTFCSVRNPIEKVDLGKTNQRSRISSEDCKG
jgi:hypothetical protein